jgi:hypothetical protein
MRLDPGYAPMPHSDPVPGDPGILIDTTAYRLSVFGRRRTAGQGGYIMIFVRRSPHQANTSLFVALLFLLWAILSTDAQEWEIECADCPANSSTMTDRSLRLDAQGNPHLAYGGDHLYYQWVEGDQFHSEIVDADHQVGKHASLGLTACWQPHISLRLTFSRWRCRTQAGRG